MNMPLFSTEGPQYVEYQYINGVGLVRITMSMCAPSESNQQTTPPTQTADLHTRAVDPQLC